MISPGQDKLYFREWGAVRKVQPDADRHALHVQALGYDKSHKEFTNAEFDRVLAEFRAISQPANLNAQLRQQQQPLVRLKYAIRQAPKAYWQKVAQSRFGTAQLDDLTEEQLTQLRNTLAARFGAQRRKAKATPAPTPEPVAAGTAQDQDPDWNV